MASEKFFGNANLAADFAHFVFIEGCERLDEASGIDERLNPGNAIVVGLDEIGFGSAAGFDGIGINCSLAENPAAIQEVAGLQNAFLDFQELLADGAAFLFRI